MLNDVCPLFNSRAYFTVYITPDVFADRSDSISPNSAWWGTYHDYARWNQDQIKSIQSLRTTDENGRCRYKTF